MVQTLHFHQKQVKPQRAYARFHAVDSAYKRCGYGRGYKSWRCPFTHLRNPTPAPTASAIDTHALSDTGNSCYSINIMLKKDNGHFKNDKNKSPSRSLWISKTICIQGGFIINRVTVVLMNQMIPSPRRPKRASVMLYIFISLKYCISGLFLKDIYFFVQPYCKLSFRRDPRFIDSPFCSLYISNIFKRRKSSGQL